MARPIQFDEIIETISGICDLEQPAYGVQASVDHVSLIAIRRLRKANLLPPRSDLKDDLSEAQLADLDLPESVEGSPGKLDSESSIFELLGVYKPRTHEVVVFEMMCRVVAKRLMIDIDSLERIVAAHEVSHAVTHIGRDSRSRIWTYFESVEEAILELFAQIYALIHAETTKDAEAVAAFHTLSEHQNDVYNGWKIFEHSPLEDVNQRLMEERNKVPQFTKKDADKSEESSLKIGGLDVKMCAQFELHDVVCRVGRSDLGFFTFVGFREARFKGKIASLEKFLNKKCTYNGKLGDDRTFLCFDKPNPKARQFTRYSEPKEFAKAIDHGFKLSYNIDQWRNQSKKQPRR